MEGCLPSKEYIHKLAIWIQTADLRAESERKTIIEMALGSRKLLRIDEYAVWVKTYWIQIKCHLPYLYPFFNHRSRYGYGSVSKTCIVTTKSRCG